MLVIWLGGAFLLVCTAIYFVTLYRMWFEPQWEQTYPPRREVLRFLMSRANFQRVSYTLLGILYLLACDAVYIVVLMATLGDSHP